MVVLLLRGNGDHVIFDVLELLQLVSHLPPLDHHDLCIIDALSCTLSIVLLGIRNVVLVDLCNAILISKVGTSSILEKGDVESLRLLINDLLWQIYHVTDIFVDVEVAPQDKHDLVGQVAF